MKKIFLMFAVMFASLAASAQTWKLVKSIDYAESTWRGWNAADFKTENGAMVVTNAEKKSQNYELQYHGLDGMTVEEGTIYKVCVTIQGDGNGEIALALCDWGHNGKNGKTLPFTTEKQTIEYEVASEFSAGGCFLMMQSGFYVGSYSVYKIEVYEQEAANKVEPLAFVKNFAADAHRLKVYDAESESKEKWSDVSGEITVVTPAKVSQDWDSQIWFVMKEALTSDAKVRLKFDAKASAAQSLSTGAHAEPGAWKAGGIFDNPSLTTEWKTFDYTIAAKAGWQSFALDLTKATEVTYDFKNISIDLLETINMGDAACNLKGTVMPGAAKAGLTLSFAGNNIAAVAGEDAALTLLAKEAYLKIGEETVASEKDAKGAASEIKLFAGAEVKEGAAYTVVIPAYCLQLVDAEGKCYWVNTKDMTMAYSVAATAKIPSGEYLIKNVKTGKFLGAGNSWGTQASLVKHGLVFTVTALENGKYTFDSHTYNGAAKHFLGAKDNGTAYVDAEAAEFTLMYLDGGICMYVNEGEYYAANAEGTVMNSVATEPAVWQFLGIAEALEVMGTATAEAPVDATFLIKAANFNRSNYNQATDGAWTVEEGCTNKNLNGGANENMCAESYHSPFNIHQVIEGAPNGIYALTAQGFYRQDGADAENMPVFYINEESTLLPVKGGSENSMTEASASFTKGDYTINPIFVKVEDGKIDLGVKNDNATLWCIWDNFELAYYGTEANILDLQLATYVAKLADLKAEKVEGKMGATEAADLEAAQAVEPEKSVEAYSEAINELSKALTAAKNSVANYAQAQAYALIFAANAEALGVDIAEAKAAYEAAYEAGTLEDFVPFKAVADEAVKAAIAAEGVVALEESIQNGSFETGDLTGWTATGLHTATNKNFGMLTGNIFVENWTPGPGKLADEVMSQNVNLPAGQYILTAEAQFLQQGDGSVTPVGFKLFAGEAEATITNIAGTYAVAFTVETEGEVTLGAKIQEATGNWASIDNFKLYQMPAEEKILGTKFELSWNGMEIPADALKTYNFSGQWQSMKADPADFDPANDKQIVIKFAEPLANNSWNFGYTKADGEIQWNVTDADKTGWTVFEADVTDIMNGFFIQNTGSANSMTIAESYVVKNDESQVALSWTPDGWGPSIAVSGITSGNANITSQWAGVNMTAPEEFLQDGTKTLRIYANADMTGLPFQWCLTDIDGNASYPQLGVDETGLYAEFSTDLKIKSLYLQHTSTEAHAIDIKAITWEFVAATAAEPVELASQKIDAKGGELVFSEGVELADGINIALNADAPLVGATVNLTVDDADATKVLVSYSVEDLPAGNYNFEIPEGVIVSSTTSGVYAGGKFEFTVEGEETAIEAVKAVSKDGKYLENDKIVIVKNGKKYNTVGARIK